MVLDFPTFSWIERVPSFSNPADDPSRQKREAVCRLLGIEQCLEFIHPPELLNRLTA